MLKLENDLFVVEREADSREKIQRRGKVCLFASVSRSMLATSLVFRRLRLAVFAQKNSARRFSYH